MMTSSSFFFFVVVQTPLINQKISTQIQVDLIDLVFNYEPLPIALLKMKDNKVK